MSTIIGAIIGATIAGLFDLAKVILEHKLNKQEEPKQEPEDTTK